MKIIMSFVYLIDSFSNTYSPLLPKDMLFAKLSFSVFDSRKSPFLFKTCIATLVIFHNFVNIKYNIDEENVCDLLTVKP